ncbi:hypothetical protein VT84_27340 [Gemmata sp. SH-PL17]|uniref:hypothetical protein n=1 Tax=Gemmata sp. SH-PL17 TaxID=1630693 RepID=UPI00078C9F5D|nr:hypothetical protein [Gemmata sp. SH-PL17]AMV28151.1 hypothetical protein VT84_27340 [Gemmata sp. SH-PL17]
MKRSVTSRIIVLACVTVAVGVPAGCSKKQAAIVRGTVTYKGAALKTGTITFHGADKEVASAAIQPDGSYTCTDVPMGDVKVTVEQFGAGLPGGLKAGGPGMPGMPGKTGGSTLPGKGTLPGAGPPGGGGGGLITPGGGGSSTPTKAPDNAPPAPELAKLPATVNKPDTSPLKYTIDAKEKTIDVVVP